MTPKVPEAVTNDAGHAEITIIFLIILVVLMGKLWWLERRRSIQAAEKWANRVEGKLDQAIAAHHQCQKEMPYRYVTKEEFKELIVERNRQWSEFNAKFDKALEIIWNHTHTVDGRVRK